MLLVFAQKELLNGLLTASSASVAQGKVTSATPAFEWAVGKGLHVLLSHCASRGIKWKKRKSPDQRQLRLVA